MNIIVKQFGRFFEDFEVGTVIRHAVTKTVCESDNNMFCLLTMNHHPVHLDKAFASREQHGQILVVGTYVFSLAVGLTVADISGKAIANLEYSNVKHEAPVFVGDTLRCETIILEKRLSQSKNDRGVIRVETHAFNQNDMCVLSFQRAVLVKKEV